MAARHDIAIHPSKATHHTLCRFAFLAAVAVAMTCPLPAAAAPANGYFEDGMEFFNSFINTITFSKKKKTKTAPAAEARSYSRRTAPKAVPTVAREVDIPLPLAKCRKACGVKPKAAAETVTNKIAPDIETKLSAPVVPKPIKTETKRPFIAAEKPAARPAEQIATVKPLAKTPVATKPRVTAKPIAEQRSAAAVRGPRKRTTATTAKCLPPDLYSLIKEKRGPAPGLAVCAQSCQPAPANLSVPQRKLLEKKHGLDWCGRRCLKIDAHLPLKDIERIERVAGVTVCVTPVTRLRPPKVEAPMFGRTYPRIRATFGKAVKATKPPARVALLIGNKNYSAGLPPNHNAHRDIAAVYTVLRERAGMRTTDIIDLRDANRAALLEILGTAKQPGIGLQALLRGRKDAEVLIYYSGHAATNATASEAFLLPVDASAGTSGGYSLEHLYGALRKMAPRRTLLVLESDFNSEISQNVPTANLTTRNVRLAPSSAVPGLTIVSAASGDQKSLEDPAYQTGLFTRYFVESLAGAGDRLPFGDGNGQLDTLEAYVFAAQRTRKAALKSFGVRQTPFLMRTLKTLAAGAAETVIAEAQ